MTWQPVLDQRTLNRTLLGRQLLLERVSKPAFEVIEYLGGMQAQGPLVPYFGLWTRLDGFRPQELVDLIESRAVVRAPAMLRTTIHLMSARDYVAMRPVLQSVQERGFRTGSPFGRLLAGLDIDDLVATGRRLLEEAPRNGTQLRKLLAERYPGWDEPSLAYAVRYLVPVVQTPPRGIWGKGGVATITSSETWLGGKIGADTRPDDMIIRYLRAFGPASVLDIQAWSWLTRLKADVERLRPRLRTFRDERGRELFDVEDGLLVEPDTPAPPRFLPEYDNLLLSHDDRSRIIPPGMNVPLPPGAGGSIGTVLVDGYFGGMWRMTRDGKRANLSVHLARPVAAHERGPIAAEGEALIRFATEGQASQEITFVDPA
jgi:hypothetical protein